MGVEGYSSFMCSSYLAVGKGRLPAMPTFQVHFLLPAVCLATYKVQRSGECIALLVANQGNLSVVSQLKRPTR